jgi:hypothetical protein
MRRPSYGASPLHLLAHATAFAIAGYALAQIVRGGTVVNFIAWFAGAAVVHDVVFLPLYSVLDRLTHRALRGQPPHRALGGYSRERVPVINHVRVPAMISGLLLLVYFPLILGLSDGKYFAASGRHLGGYARNWLGITAVLFAGSAVLYAIRVTRARP